MTSELALHITYTSAEVPCAIKTYVWNKPPTMCVQVLEHVAHISTVLSHKKFCFQFLVELTNSLLYILCESNTSGFPVTKES
jgi:hypothetical protein